MRNLFVRVCEREGRKEGSWRSTSFPKASPISSPPTPAKVTVLTLSLFSSPFPFSPIILSFFFFPLSLHTKFSPREDFVGEKKTIFFYYFILLSLVQFTVITFSTLFCPSGKFICPFSHSIPYPPPTQPLGARERSLEGFKRLLSRAAQAARRTASGNWVQYHTISCSPFLSPSWTPPSTIPPLWFPPLWFPPLFRTPSFSNPSFVDTLLCLKT